MLTPKASARVERTASWATSAVRSWLSQGIRGGLSTHRHHQSPVNASRPASIRVIGIAIRAGGQFVAHLIGPLSLRTSRAPS
jgi:hypothetical protein